jgi:hypothetical protein
MGKREEESLYLLQTTKTCDYLLKKIEHILQHSPMTSDVFSFLNSGFISNPYLSLGYWDTKWTEPAQDQSHSRHWY